MIQKSELHKGDKVELLEDVILEKTFRKDEIGEITKPKTGFVFESEDGKLSYGVEVKFDNGYLQISPKFLKKKVE